MKKTWIIDLISNAATHSENGAVIQFKKDSYRDGELLVDPGLDASCFPKLMREAGKALKKQKQLLERIGPLVFETAMQDLLNADESLLGVAKPPLDIGVYAFYYENELKYIGSARGRMGLCDRLKSKHITGDDSHTLHKVFISKFPNKDDRKAYFTKHVSAKWVAFPYPFTTVLENRKHRKTVLGIENLLIGSLQPEWNEK
jgi:hypothetical protein